ncbi:MurT ligase domain-containing protein [Syntrophomonas erecta]
MKRIRLIIAILIGKMAIYLSRALGNQGTDFPGRIARRVAPWILAELAQNISEEIFIITGTNGKTTTTNMIARIIEEKGYSFIHNQAGANMITGITTAFIEKTDILGRRAFDYALLETDEANVPLLLKEVHPRVVLITNFFRDQLDRYGELDYTINLIKDAVRYTDVELVLNADDPLVAHFQNDTGLHCWYYGFEATGYDRLVSEESREGRFCVFCGQELVYKRYHYAQLGKYQCPGCNNCNPRRNFTGYGLQMDPQIHFMVNDIELTSPYQGFYNAYNILAAVSLAKLVGIEDNTIRNAIAAYQPEAGRMERFSIGQKTAVLVLVKNPTGLNQALEAINNDPAEKALFFALNDNAADGRDISWIWDADVEITARPGTRIKAVICSGQRSGDAAVRFKYAGFDPRNISIESELEPGILRALEMSGETSYILSTYTVLFSCRKILLRLHKNRPAGEQAENKDRRGELWLNS